MRSQDLPSCDGLSWCPWWPLNLVHHGLKSPQILRLLNRTAILFVDPWEPLQQLTCCPAHNSWPDCEMGAVGFEISGFWSIPWLEGRTCLLVTRVQFHIPVDSVGLFSRFLKTGVKLLHFLLHPHLMASSNPENDLKSQQGHIEPHASWVMRIISFCDTTFRTIFLAATVLLHTLHELKPWNFCFLETLKIKIAVTMSQWFLSSLKMQKW